MFSFALWPEIYFGHAYFYALNSSDHQNITLYDSSPGFLLCWKQFHSNSSGIFFFFPLGIFFFFLPDMIVHKNKLIRASISEENLV